MSTALAWILFSVVGFVAEPCPQEDTIPQVRACYWDAAARGNGEGQSTITFPGGMTFRTEYAP